MSKEEKNIVEKSDNEDKVGQASLDSKGSSKSGKKIFLGLSAAAFLGLTIFGASIFYRNQIDQKLPSGTVVAGVELSYLTKEQALDLLEASYNNYIKSPFKVQYGGNVVEISGEDIDLKVELAGTLNEIDVLDSKNTSIIDLLFNSKGKEHDLKYSLSYNKFFDKLDKNFYLTQRAPKPPSFNFNEAGELITLDGEPGYILDEKPLVASLDKSIQNLTSDQVKISLKESFSEIEEDSIEVDREYVQELINKSITLQDPIYSDDWVIKLADNPAWISFAKSDASSYSFLSTEANSQYALPSEEQDLKKGKVLALKVNRDEFIKYVDKEISPWLDIPTEKVTITMDKAGEVTIEGRGNDGKSINRKELMDSIDLALATEVDTLTVPVENIVPELEIDPKLQELGITERIGVGHSSYYSSSVNRKFNISLGASQFDGKLIKPGENFSFNKNLGEVTYAAGYKAELVIKGGDVGTVPEVGGGLCQVSTTVYRAALMTGLPITERRNHSYKVSYYAQTMGDGMDATIYLGGQDLMFLNDTEDHLLMHTFIDKDNELYVVFYGTNPDGRSVEMEGPYLSNYRYPGPTVVKTTSSLPPGVRKQVENSHVGFEALWYRHITYEDGTKETEPIKSVYKAIPARVLVGAPAAAPAAEGEVGG